MSEFVNQIFELSINLLEGFIIVAFVSNFLGYKYEGIKRLISIIIGVSVNLIYITFMNNLTAFEGIGVLISVILLFCYCLGFTKGSLQFKAFISASTFVIIFVINMVVLTSVSFITQLDISILLSENISARHITLIITKIIFFLATRILLVFKNKEEFSLSFIEWIALISITIISILIGVFIMEIILQNSNLKSGNSLIILSMLGIVIINIVIYYLLLRLSIKNKQKLKYIMLEQEYKYQRKHNEDVNQLYKEFSKASHDMKNHFTCIIGMIEKDQKQNAIDYIQNIIKEKINIGPQYIETNSEVANHILNSKLDLCKALNIDVKTCIIGNLNIISEIEMCILLGNILDNAIEACKSLTHPKITIDIRSNMNHLQILVGNTINDSVLKLNPLFITNKKDSKHHGYGVLNIKGIISKYNGLIEYYEKDDMIYCDIMI